MGQYIVERVLSPETDRRIGVSAGHLVRPVSFLSGTWTTIRIGGRWAVNAATGTVAPAELFVGLVSNTSQAWGSSYCSHAVGAWYATTPFTNNTSYTGIGYGYFSKRVVHTTTVLNASAILHTSYPGAIPLTNATVRNCAWVLEFQKKPGDIWGLTFSGGRGSASGTYANQAENAVFDTITLPTMADIDGALGTTNGSVLQRDAAAGAINEAVDGALTSVCLYWRNATLPLEVCDISVALLE